MNWGEVGGGVNMPSGDVFDNSVFVSSLKKEKVGLGLGRACRP